MTSTSLFFVFCFVLFLLCFAFFQPEKISSMILAAGHLRGVRTPCTPSSVPVGRGVSGWKDLFVVPQRYLLRKDWPTIEMDSLRVTSRWLYWSTQTKNWHKYFPLFRSNQFGRLPSQWKRYFSFQIQTPWYPFCLFIICAYIKFSLEYYHMVYIGKTQLMSWRRWLQKDDAGRKQRGRLVRAPNFEIWRSRV